MSHINSNLITLKCVIFLFFGGIGCLLPFLPLDVINKGLTVDEAKIIAVVAPAVAILGPLIAAPLADKLAGVSDGSKRSKNANYLRIMIGLCLILAAVFYWLLMAVPTTATCPTYNIVPTKCNKTRNLFWNITTNNTKPAVRSYHHHPSFAGLVCNSQGGQINIEKCTEDKPCNDWEQNAVASFYVTNCNYTCESEEYNNYTTTVLPEEDVSQSASEYDFRNYDETNLSSNTDEPAMEVDLENKVQQKKQHVPQKPIPNPHLCHNMIDGNGTFCHVYSTFSQPLNLRVPFTLAQKETNEFGMCTYSIGANFHCRMGPQVEEDRTIDFTEKCKPVITCELHNHPSGYGNFTVETPCTVNPTSFWLYLLIRSLADIFPVAAIVLLDAAVIIATRETSSGRGDAGKQFAAGALGLAIFPPIVTAIDISIVYIAVFSACMILAALIILFDSKMPLSPPEWWWHTKCGLLAFPSSSIKRYGLEISGLGFVMFLLGIFWNGIDPFLPWHINSLSGSALNIGLTITVGALPAVLVLIFIEKIVDYCGHNNILIASFAFYIIHYTALVVIENPWLYLIVEALEIFTLHVTWVTAVLYLRHLVPRQFTVCGQALPVIVHFCLGRICGVLIGGLAFPRTTSIFQEVHESLAAAAAVIAVLYFVTYHFMFKPYCVVPVAEMDRPSPALIQSVNGNGAYTPLRVYHNSKAKKGHFKY